MMKGAVNSQLEPMLELAVRDAAGGSHLVEGVVDTGFNGFLTLPPSVIAALGLPWLCRQQGELADGSVMVFDVHEAVVEWHGRQVSVEIEGADAQPLLGMSLMRGSELRVQVMDGGTVAIEETP